jgi:hypothetical protein
MYVYICIHIHTYLCIYSNIFYTYIHFYVYIQIYYIQVYSKPSAWGIENYVEKSVLREEKYLHGGQITLKAKVTVT